MLRESASARSLDAIASLPNSKHPEPIGKAGEQIHAVRFNGARGYLVTFRAVDPLYVLDLTDPATRAAHGIAPEDFACPWKDLSTRGIRPP